RLYRSRRSILLGCFAQGERGQRGAVVLGVLPLPWLQRESKPWPCAGCVAARCLQRPHLVERGARVVAERAGRGVGVSEDQRVENGLRSPRFAGFGGIAASSGIIGLDV